MRVRFILLVLAIGLFTFAACQGSDLVDVHEGTPKVTLEQFNRLQIGMSQSEVERIIAGDCVVQSEVGEKGTQFHTVMYGCDGSGKLGANMNYMIQDGKLSTKAQFGLQ
jgi:hypothetical protein